MTKKMDLYELEKQIIALEADQLLPQTSGVISGIPTLKQDLASAKAQLDAFVNSQTNIM